MIFKTQKTRSVRTHAVSAMAATILIYLACTCPLAHAYDTRHTEIRIEFRRTIRPGDILICEIEDKLPCGYCIKRLHVSREGHILVPIVGPIRVAGLTESDAAATILRALIDARLFREAEVTVQFEKADAAPAVGQAPQ
jgi:protein involved in polysaccharide export with SLBB domain